MLKQTDIQTLNLLQIDVYVDPGMFGYSFIQAVEMPGIAFTKAHGFQILNLILTYTLLNPFILCNFKKSEYF